MPFNGYNIMYMVVVVGGGGEGMNDLLSGTNVIIDHTCLFVYSIYSMSEARVEYSAGDHRLTCGLTILDHIAMSHTSFLLGTYFIPVDIIVTSCVCTALDNNFKQ